MAIPKIQNSEFFSLLNNKKDLLKRDIEKTRVLIGKEVVRLLTNSILKDQIVLSPNEWTFHYCIYGELTTLVVGVALKSLTETKISIQHYKVNFVFSKQGDEIVEFYTEHDPGDPRECGDSFKTEKSALLCKLMTTFKNLLVINRTIFPSNPENYTYFTISF